MSRKANILDYLNNYSGGFYNSENTDRNVLVEKVVGNVLAFHDIAETPENVRNYSAKLEELAKDDTVIIRKNIYTHTWMIETRD